MISILQSSHKNSRPKKKMNSICSVLAISLVFFISPDKKCVDESNCKFWSFIPTRKFCFLLSSFVENPQEGVVSGYSGCMVPDKSFTIFSMVDEELECTVTYEPKDICPPETEKIDARVYKVFTYFVAPPSIACTKITEIVCKGAKLECKTKAPIELPVPLSLFVKTTLTDPTKCEVATTPKIIDG